MPTILLANPRRFCAGAIAISDVMTTIDLNHPLADIAIEFEILRIV